MIKQSLKISTLVNKSNSSAKSEPDAVDSLGKSKIFHEDESVIENSDEQNVFLEVL